jgi:hypothetical protein
MEIARIRWPSKDRFHSDFVDAGIPVVLSRGLGGSRAASWTPAYLSSVIGHRRVAVAKPFADGSFGYTRTEARMQMQFAAAVRLIESNEKYYIMQVPVRECLPELMDDVDIPEVIPPHELRVLNLWCGAAGNLTQLLFDLSNNLLAQTCGEKEITLFPPQQSAYLYPFPPDTPQSHVSQVDFARPDRVAHPLFGKATPLRVLLGPGDVLYVPPYWWHAVRSMSTSVSLNFWWQVGPCQFLAPIALERLVWMYDRTRLRDMPISGRGLIDVARHSLSRAGPDWAAVLLAAAALEGHLRKILSSYGVAADSVPARLDAVNAALAATASVEAVDAERIGLWARLVAEAHRQSAARLAHDVVAAMVEEISARMSGATGMTSGAHG